MLIILEGPDSTGKSVLSRSIAEWLGCEVHKPPGSPAFGMSVDVSQAEDRGAVGVAALAAHAVDIVFDRWFPSEFSYGMSFGRQHDIKLVWDLDDLVSKLPHIALFCYAKVGDHTPVQEGDVEPDETKWNTIAGWYRQYISASKMWWEPIHRSTPAGQLILAQRAIEYRRTLC